MFGTLRRIHNNSSIGVCFGSRNRRDSVNQMGPFSAFSRPTRAALQVWVKLCMSAAWVVGMIKNNLQQLLPTHPPDLNPFAIGSLKLSASP